MEGEFELNENVEGQVAIEVEVEEDRLPVSTSSESPLTV